MKLRRILILLVIAFFPICFSTYSATVPNTLRNITIGTIKPVLDLSNLVSTNIAGGVSKIRDYFRLYEENVHLKTKVDELSGQLITSTELEKENERLKSLLDFKDKEKLKSWPARVILRDISHWSNWVVLNKGSKNGIRASMPIASPEGLVGRVMYVEDGCSRAMLITDIESKVSVMVQTTRDMGIIEGGGRGLLTMRYLPLDSQAKVGDAVVTSGLGSIYPKGLPVGRIEVIGQDRNGLTLFAMVKPFANFSHIEEVLCLERIREN